jgi:hypothetical protein
MRYSPEFLDWREAEYRVTDAEEQLRVCIHAAGEAARYLEVVKKVCALRMAAAQELAALLLSIK